jgi:hypothetical protein
MRPATTFLYDSDSGIPPGGVPSRLSEADPAVSPRQEIGEARPDPTALKRAVMEEGAAHYVPLDTAALDPPSVCDRCHRPILPDDPIDYLVADDSSVAIVHESCAGPEDAPPSTQTDLDAPTTGRGSGA